ncbi:Periplasmic protein [Salmonella enterica subsp. enterica]|uniref:Periplasmic protein n=1 Tax=Salmonella enterica I TaxID=59201 RepID=A0A379WUW3_SALET|nr:Periplasmic protein [Salmonella enterica subsp. enterica]
MRKLTALFVASTLAMGAANLAHAAETTTRRASGCEANDAA